jgi:PAS domain S-box-containing protein/diguanylate cyclase (GGDEF)-like protein
VGGFDAEGDSRDRGSMLEGRDRQRAEEKYRNLFELSHDVVLLFDESGTILEANRHAGERLGYEEGELEDRTFRDLHPPEDLELGEEYFRRTLEEGDMRFSAGLLKRDGTTFPADITATRLRLGDGTVVQAVVRDMTERVEAERALRASERRHRLLFERNVAGVFRSYLDGEILQVNEACARMLGYRSPDEVKGTGAERLYVDTADRDRLEARLRSDGVVENYEQRLRRRDGTPIWVLESSVLVEDPSEGRKIIDDTLGHAAGDRILVETAEKLRARMREADTAARVGGDEFAVLLTDVEHPEGALAAARRLAEEFELPCRVDDRTVHLDARLGVALFPDHADDFDALLSAADRAMYASKRGGFPTISLYRPDEEGRFRDELALEEALRSALDQDQLTLYYQPIFGMPEGTVEGAEALLRWHHPERGLLSAGEFVHLSERTPLVQAIDRWVVEQAVAQAARWSGGADPDWVTVNLSAATFRDPELATEVERHLKAHDVDPERLVVELAERTAMRNPDVVVETLLELRELGVRVAIDDFGTGHSALAYLKKFPADLLKLDGQFIKDLTEGDEVQGVARAVMDLGRALGMEMVAERVEEASQFRCLDEAGCAYVQGFYTGEPVPPEAIGDQGRATRGA